MKTVYLDTEFSCCFSGRNN